MNKNDVSSLVCSKSKDLYNIRISNNELCLHTVFCVARVIVLSRSSSTSVSNFSNSHMTYLSELKCHTELDVLSYALHE